MTPIAPASMLFVALSLHSLPARSEMYVCGKPDGTSVLRNMACGPQERTVSINGLSPQVWEKRNAGQQVIEANARASEEAAARAEEKRPAAGPVLQRVAGALAESGGTVGAAGAGLRHVLDPFAAPNAILEANKPRPR